MDDRQRKEVTGILARCERGDGSAAAILLPLVYDKLRALAGSYFRGQRSEHTLQPTALVHEVFLKLAGTGNGDWKSRAHFFAVAARAMRQVLTDHARRKSTTKRGGDQHRVTLSGIEVTRTPELDVDLVALEEALAKLAELSPRQSRIVEMRFLAGMNEEEIAHVLGVTARTVFRDWRVAKAFLQCELSGESLS